LKIKRRNKKNDQKFEKKETISFILKRRWKRKRKRRWKRKRKRRWKQGNWRFVLSIGEYVNSIHGQ
jgi:hypothetical protein